MEKCSFYPTEGDVTCVNRINTGICVKDCYQCDLGIEENVNDLDERKDR